MTRKPWFIALCIVGGIATMIAIGVFAVDGLRKAFLRTIMFTTADPDVLGEFSSTSMEPKTVVLQVKGQELISTDGGQIATGRRLDRSLTVTAPAAYFSKISVKEGPTGPQHFAISVWSRTFDPALPDVIEWERARRIRSSGDTIATRYQRRIEEADEYVLEFTVVNGGPWNSHESRQRTLKLLAQGDAKRPCVKGYDPELKMVTYSAPKDFVAGSQSCLEGTHHNAINFSQLDESGDVRFTVRCSGSGPQGAPIDRSDRPDNTSLRNRMCQMHGFFKSWPFQAFVMYRHRSEWADVHDRIQQFLASIATEKLGPGEAP
jgi:hypothetical protein